LPLNEDMIGFCYDAISVTYRWKDAIS